MIISTQKAFRDHDLKLLPATFPWSNPVRSRGFHPQDCPRECFLQGDSRTSFGLLVFGGFLLACWELLITQRQQDLSSSMSSPLTGTSNVKLLVMKTKASQTFPGFLSPSTSRLSLTPPAGPSQLLFILDSAEVHHHSDILRQRRFPESIIRDTSPFLVPCFLGFFPSTFLSFFSLA